MIILFGYMFSQIIIFTIDSYTCYSIIRWFLYDKYITHVSLLIETCQQFNFNFILWGGRQMRTIKTFCMPVLGALLVSFMLVGCGSSSSPNATVVTGTTTGELGAISDTTGQVRQKPVSTVRFPTYAAASKLSGIA